MLESIDDPSEEPQDSVSSGPSEKSGGILENDPLSHPSLLERPTASIEQVPVPVQESSTVRQTDSWRLRPGLDTRRTIDVPTEYIYSAAQPAGQSRATYTNWRDPMETYAPIPPGQSQIPESHPPLAVPFEVPRLNSSRDLARWSPGNDDARYGYSQGAIGLELGSQNSAAVRMRQNLGDEPLYGNREQPSMVFPASYSQSSLSHTTAQHVADISASRESNFHPLSPGDTIPSTEASGQLYAHDVNPATGTRFYHPQSQEEYEGYR